MNKKIIALAVASLASGVAVAQTNVTMYGVVDNMYVYSQGKAGIGGGTNKFSGLNGGGGTAGNRLGFKGEEALGNGLKAVFTLEYGLHLDNNEGIGTSGLNARQQFVGLSGNWGTVALGRQYAPGFNATANNDALEATDMGIQSSLSVYAGNSITPNSPARYNNAITYTSNSMAGFTASAIYGFGETRDQLGTFNDNFVSVSDNGKIGLGLNYANGPVNVDVGYQSRTNVVLPNLNPPPFKAPGSGSSINEWYVGGSWDFKVVKAFASYQALDNNANIIAKTIDDSNLWTLGLSAPVGPGTFAVSYGRLSLDRKNLADGDSWGAGTMYTYPLSKRTAVYAAYSYFNNDKYSIPGQAIITPGLIGAPGESNYTVGAGLMHSF